MSDTTGDRIVLLFLAFCFCLFNFSPVNISDQCLQLQIKLIFSSLTNFPLLLFDIYKLASKFATVCFHIQRKYSEEISQTLLKQHICVTEDLKHAVCKQGQSSLNAIQSTFNLKFKTFRSKNFYLSLLASA